MSLLSGVKISWRRCYGPGAGRQAAFSAVRQRGGVWASARLGDTQLPSGIKSGNLADFPARRFGGGRQLSGVLLPCVHANAAITPPPLERLLVSSSRLSGLQTCAGGFPACRGHGPDPRSVRRRPRRPGPASGSRGRHRQEGVSGRGSERLFLSQSEFVSARSAASGRGGKRSAMRVNYSRSRGSAGAVILNSPPASAAAELPFSFSG